MNESPNPVRFVLAYLFWAVTVALTIFVLLQWRTSLLIVLGTTPWHRYTEQAINQFGFIILALFSLGVIVYVEHFYRTGVEKGRLFERFFRVTFIQMVFLLVAHIATLVGTAILGLPMGIAWLVSLAEAAGCLLLYWLYRQASKRDSSNAI